MDKDGKDARMILNMIFFVTKKTQNTLLSSFMEIQGGNIRPYPISRTIPITWFDRFCKLWRLRMRYNNREIISMTASLVFTFPIRDNQFHIDNGAAYRISRSCQD